MELDRLHHRLLRANTLQNRVRTDSIGQLLDAGDAFIAALGHDVGRAELACELLPRLVTAHRDDPFRAHLLGGEHTEQADRAVTDHHDRLARLHVRRIGGKPARAHDIGERQQARDQVLRGNIRSGDQGAVRERDTQHSGACAVPTNSACWQDDW